MRSTIISSTRSPNHGDKMQSVDFVVIHYTAVPLDRTIQIFLDRVLEASSHFVIDLDGKVYELVPALTEEPVIAHHAGRSFLPDSQNHDPNNATFRMGFNKFSIGIEIVNPNGNLFPFTEEQYDSLDILLSDLKEKFPNLKDPKRIVGHDDIAWWRGKCDPGVLFDWQRFLPADVVKLRRKGCDPKVLAPFLNLVDSLGFSRGKALSLQEFKSNAAIFERLSSLMEVTLGSRYALALDSLPAEIKKYALG